jgi:hypothetical protein
MPQLPQDRLRRPMTVLSGIRRRIQKLGPYQSLILILLPLLLVEPLEALKPKLLMMRWFAKG